MIFLRFSRELEEGKEGEEGEEGEERDNDCNSDIACFVQVEGEGTFPLLVDADGGIVVIVG